MSGINQSKPCTNPKRCDGTMTQKIVAPIERPGVVRPSDPYVAWVCGKCGHQG